MNFILHIKGYLSCKEIGFIFIISISKPGIIIVPVIRTGTGTKAELMVTDPSLQKLKALTLNEWFLSINNSNIRKYTFVLPDKYFFDCGYIHNSLTNVFDGSFLTLMNWFKMTLQWRRARR